ncbi:dihydropteroate synthase, partial [Rothia koreensis]
MSEHIIGRRSFDFEKQIAVMAVVNRTPDSFYDRGRTYEIDAAVSSAVQAAEQGADWVDIGGVPFGRGPAVSPAEELERIVP